MTYLNQQKLGKIKEKNKQFYKQSAKRKKKKPKKTKDNNIKP